MCKPDANIAHFFDACIVGINLFDIASECEMKSDANAPFG